MDDRGMEFVQNIILFQHAPTKKDFTFFAPSG
jgi:hypothetical protein